jgi:hypothetical protein
MSNKSLLILASVTIIIIIAAAISTSNRAPQTVVENPPLLPDLRNRINDISQIIIESPDNAVHITKLDDAWGVMQSDNYPARFDKVKKLVLDIAGLNIISEKTSNPDLFRELGVEDPSAENAASKMLTLLDGSGNELSRLIIGNTRPRDGLYLRKAGTNDTYLVDGNPEVTADPGDWVESDLLDIANERVMETTIEHPDGEIITLSREQGSEDFTLAEIPEGRKARSGYFTNQPATFLADLTIENAKSRENFTFPEPQVITTIRTYDGLVANINSAKIDNVNHAIMEFSVDESRLTTASADEEETVVIGEQPEQQPDVRQEAEELNNKVDNWVFIIPQSKYLLLTKRIDELTDAIETESTE